jgi:acyl-CoA reductase-like NAD-dependent aldehyde dehydrogenase
MTTARAHPLFRDSAADVVAGDATADVAVEASVAAAGIVSGARHAQRAWSAVPVTERLRRLRALRHAVAARATELAAAIDSPGRTTVERLASEVLPLADAIRFLERRAGRLLRPRRFGARGRPLWLGRSRLEVRREPFGVVLIIGPANYPLLLAGVQAVQAIAAGNAAVIKPAPGHSGPARLLAALAADAGLDPSLLVVLGEEVHLVEDAVRVGVDKVVLTGSAETGQAVSALLAPHLTPAVMELSGHDSAFVCEGADLDLAARCIAYGVTLNGGGTCIAPRRVFVRNFAAPELETKLNAALGAAASSAALSIIPVRDMDQALAVSNDCPYRLGATIFGPAAAAAALAARVDAGCVVINDAIVPTADPRLPFGGRGRSGYGVTRGAEGLLEMTRVKAIATRVGSFRPHLDRPHPLDAGLFAGYVAAAHGGSWRSRLRAAAGVVRTVLRRRNP